MPATTTRSHLDPAAQDEALALRLQGRRWTYGVIADCLGFTNANAAMYACEAASRRLNGDSSATRRFTRVTTSSVETGEPTDVLFLNRRFGVEVEYSRGTIVDYNPPAAVARAISAAGVECYDEGYNHTTRPYWKSTTDATVTGGEVVSPILSGDAGFAQLKTVLETIKAQGGTMGTGAGAHVHHDVNDLGAAQMATLVNNLRNAQDALCAFVPARRHNGSNGYVRRNTTREWDTLAQHAADGHLVAAAHRSAARNLGSGIGRYVAFNFNSVLTYGTVEFRLHHGTFASYTLRCWIAVGQAIVEMSRRGLSFAGVQTVESMLDALIGHGLLHRAMRSRFIARTAAANSRRAAA